MENYDLSKLLPDVDKWKRRLETVYANISSKRQVKYFLHRLHPGCILRNSTTDKAWDRHLRKKLMNPQSLKRLSDFHIEINGVRVWVQNYPYAYGSPSDGSRESLPSRKTVVMLKMLVDAMDEEISKRRYK